VTAPRISLFFWGGGYSPRVWGTEIPQWGPWAKPMVGCMGDEEADAVCRHFYRFWL